MVGFWIKYDYLDLISGLWMLNMSLAWKLDVVQTKWVDYENFHMGSEDVIWINYVSIWVYGSVLSNSVKKNIEKCIRLIMGWLANLLDIMRWNMGGIIVHVF